MLGLGQAERGAEGALVQHVGNQVLLVGPAEVADHQHERIVADDRVFVLQVVEQAQALGRQVLADHRHPEIGAILAAIGGWQGEAIVPRLVGQLAGLGQQLFPLVFRQTAAVPVGAGPFAAVVEEALIVVARLQRRDLAIDEGVELGEIGRELRRQVEVHGKASLLIFWF